MAKYQTFTPGEYFDWEQPMVKDRLEEYENYQRKPGGELFDTTVLTEEEIIRRIEEITLDDVMAIIPKVLDPNAMCASAVGRVDALSEKLRTRLG